MRRAKAVKAIVASVAVVTAAMGFLHTPWGRPALMWIAQTAGGCPVGMGKATPAQIEAHRQETMKAMRGKERAPARPALGFTLMQSTRADITSPACKEEMKGTALRCTEGTSNVLYRFDDKGTLVAVDVMHEGGSPEDAMRRLAEVEKRLAGTLGSPQTKSDAPLAEPYARASVEYRFHDYAADVSATNFGDAVVVREQYRAIPD
jgi:hypothetical protein